MGLFSKDIRAMDAQPLHVLQDIYYAEQLILKSLDDMIEKATNRELTATLNSHPRWFTPAEAAARIPERRLGRMLRKAAKLASAAA